MGPNSGGGKRNKDNNNPSSCTRNRFSKWRPPTDNIKDKFNKQQENRASGQDERKGDKAQVVSKSKGSIEVHKSSEKGDKPVAISAVGELLTISAGVLNDLLRIFGVDTAPPKASTATKTEESDTPASKSTPAKVVSLQPAAAPKPAPAVAHTTRPQEDSLERRRSRSILSNYGFEVNEISLCLDTCRDIAERKDELAELELLLSMLMQLSNKTSTTTAVRTQLSPEDLDISSNEDLMAEIEVLSSIYGENVTYRAVALRCKPCCVVDIRVPIEDELVGRPHVFGKAVAASAAQPALLLNVRLFISDLKAYPSAAAPVYGWVLPHESTEAGRSAGKNSKQNNTAWLPTSAARQLSVGAMKHIHAYQAQTESPAAFEFIQHIREHVAGVMAALPAASVASPSASDVSSGKTASLGTAGGGRPKAPVVVKEEVVTEVVGPPPMPPRPTTQFMQSIEYRSALSAAFSASLVGEAARARARAELEYILPKSTLDALKIEEEYHEETLNRTFSIENLPTRAIIECTRLLVEGLQVNKAKAKALVASAREALLEQRDFFARTEDQLRNKIIAHATSIFRERLQRKDSKRQESMKHKTPAMTLREAFAMRRLRERAANNCDEEDDAVNAAPAAVVAPPVPTAATASTARPAGATAKSATAKQVPAELEVDDWEDEVEEEEPVDPVKVAADLAAAKEKKRLADIESKRLQARQKEKQELPKYQEMLARRQTLPAFQMKDSILDAIDKHSVVVISGDTGCGKTTQVPQLVLDDLIEKGRGGECNIIVTQPRRISAISVSERIAKERVENVGQSTGYHIRLEVKKGPATRLLLMTTGVLLRMLQLEGNLEGISHIFVDEVHERDINTDFLLIILKKLLVQRPDLKIILMSATLNATLFLDYFRGSGSGARGSRKLKNSAVAAPLCSCAMLTIPGRAFPVTDFYLEDAMQVTRYEYPANSQCIARSGKGGGGGRKPATGASPVDDKAAKRIYLETLRRDKKYHEKVISNVELADESVINTDLIQKLVLHLVATTSAPHGGPAGEPTEPDGAILIFVPGLANIQDVIESLKSAPQLNGRNSNIKIFPLHSSLSTQEQNSVFQPVPAGWRKIVVSTNIAETSVTIEDVVYVIDTCRVKENSYDEVSQMNVLEEMWISKANARQRKGRAGRVRSGICYHLVSKFTMNRLPDYMTPEMLKMSLDDMILQVLALDLGDPYVFLRGAISPPEDVAITNALLFLESLSAIVVNNFDTTRNVPGKDITCDLESEITPLGYHLAALPINPRIGKLILYGVLLQCIDPILTIASAMSVKSVFASPFGEKDLADEAKLRFLEGNSDLLTCERAVSVWKNQYGSNQSGGKGRGDPSKPNEYDYCRSNFLNVNSLRLVDQMRSQFLSLLKDIGFMPATANLENLSRCPQNANGQHLGLVKSAICAGLSPNILQIPGLSGKNQGKTLMEIALQSRSSGTMKIHPSSVMSGAKYFDSGYLVYLEAMKTTQVYVRDVTTIPPLVLALFSGRSKVNSASGAVIVDGWLQFRTPNLKVCECILRVRDAMEDAFMQKVMDPSSETTAEWIQVLKGIQGAVSSV